MPPAIMVDVKFWYRLAHDTLNASLKEIPSGLSPH